MESAFCKQHFWAESVVWKEQFGFEWEYLLVREDYTSKRLSNFGCQTASPAEKHILYGEDFFLFGGEDFVDFFHEAVVERTFAWLESFRRLNRNYEQFLYTAKGVALAACAMFMLRFV